jgi:SAM-dependent methyltransferase
MRATEQLSCDEALAYFPRLEHRATAVLRRLHRIASLPDRPRVVDVGSAQGGFLVVCAGLGYEAVGVEPWLQARQASEELARRAGVQIRIVDGTAEALPLESESYDIVHANSVIEHVSDVERAFSEAHRVLKPGGAFWFSAASTLCPRQSEIRGFPAFGWYPDPLKQRIMQWAVRERPELIGHTTQPAVNWFTPWKARRLLRRAGFSRIYDRWDLRLRDEGNELYGLVLRAVKLNAVTKLVADIAVADCSYAAIK